MSRMIVVDPVKCTNCRMCELACSLVKIGAFAPSRSASGSMSLPRSSSTSPRLLPVRVGALRQGLSAGALVQEDGLVRFVKEACIGCRMCMLGCPFGVIAFDSAAGVIAKCDTCDGIRVRAVLHAARPGVPGVELADMPKGRDFARKVAEASAGAENGPSAALEYSGIRCGVLPVRLTRPRYPSGGWVVRLASGPFEQPG